MSEAFRKFSRNVSEATGTAWVFIAAVALVVVWAVAGPLFPFCEVSQLLINTGTTIVTFLMVFLIQHTQNRDTEALQVKLDELIRATNGAHNAVLDLEELEEDDLDRIRESYEKLAREARVRRTAGELDTNQPAVTEG